MDNVIPLHATLQKYCTVLDRGAKGCGVLSVAAVALQATFADDLFMSFDYTNPVWWLAGAGLLSGSLKSTSAIRKLSLLLTPKSLVFREMQDQIEKDSAMKTVRDRALAAFVTQDRNLDLSSIGLTSFPLGLEALYDVHELDLSNNKLEVVPDQVDRLVGLRHLQLSPSHGPLDLSMALANLPNLTIGCQDADTCCGQLIVIDRAKRAVGLGRTLGDFPELRALLEQFSIEGYRFTDLVNELPGEGERLAYALWLEHLTGLGQEVGVVQQELGERLIHRLYKSGPAVKSARKRS